MSSECSEALDLKQGFSFMHSDKIRQVRESLWESVGKGYSNQRVYSQKYLEDNLLRNSNPGDDY